MQIITVYDFLLLPVYLGIFFFFVKKKSHSFPNAELSKIFLISFGLRMLGSIGYCLLVQYYYGFGDSFTFYQGSDFIHTEIIKDINNVKYFFASSADFQNWFNYTVGDMNLSGYIGITSSNAVMKISALVSFFAFNRFVIISIFFGLFSFAGQWKLFSVFNDYNKGKNQSLLAFAVLYTPSIWFWGSGLMKDSLCLGAMGFIIHFIYKFFTQKKITLAEFTALILLSMMLYTIKSYILLTLIATATITFFISYFSYFKSTLIRISVIFLLVLLSFLVFTFVDFSAQLNDLVEESYSQIQSFQKNYELLQSYDENSKAGFDLGNFDASLGSILIKSPEVIFSCLYRPFIWESKKIIILLTAIESTVLLLATLFILFRTKFSGFFKIAFSNYLILFALIVSVLFALIIGFTTFNFGTMTRYKIVLLPFYYFMLVAIYNRYTDK